MARNLDEASRLVTQAKALADRLWALYRDPATLPVRRARVLGLAKRASARMHRREDTELDLLDEAAQRAEAEQQWIMADGRTIHTLIERNGGQPALHAEFDRLHREGAEQFGWAWIMANLLVLDGAANLIDREHPLFRVICSRIAWAICEKDAKRRAERPSLLALIRDIWERRATWSESGHSYMVHLDPDLCARIEAVLISSEEPRRG